MKSVKLKKIIVRITMTIMTTSKPLRIYSFLVTPYPSQSISEGLAAGFMTTLCPVSVWIWSSFRAAY